MFGGSPERCARLLQRRQCGFLSAMKLTPEAAMAKPRVVWSLDVVYVPLRLQGLQLDIGLT